MGSRISIGPSSRGVWSVTLHISNRRHLRPIATMRPVSLPVLLVKNAMDLDANIFGLKARQAKRIPSQQSSILQNYRVTARWTYAPGAMPARALHLLLRSPTFHEK